jgi:hypothetical protein
MAGFEQVQEPIQEFFDFSDEFSEPNVDKKL